MKDNFQGKDIALLINSSYLTFHEWDQLSSPNGVIEDFHIEGQNILVNFWKVIIQ